MRIVFMGSPQFAVPSLEALHHSSHEVVAVVTQPDRPKGRKLQMQPPRLKIAAHRLNIPVLQPATTKSEIFYEEVRLFQPDLLVVVAYGEILRANLLALPTRGAVNLHGSLLPKYRGAAPIAWAILEGESVTGATTMMMNEVMDGGPILLQEECAIAAIDTAETLAIRISQSGAHLLKKTVDMLARNEIVARAQDLDRVSYAPKLRKEDGRIDWNQSALRISRQIRAFNPWPGSFSDFRGMTVKFWLAHPDGGSISELPGTVVQVNRQSLLVACGEQSVLEILEVQPQNRPRFPAADFIHGYSIRTGDRFESADESGNISK